MSGMRRYITQFLPAKESIQSSTMFLTREPNSRIWNDRSEWIWSEAPTHEAIISLEDFTSAEAVFTGAKRAKVRRERTKHSGDPLDALRELTRSEAEIEDIHHQQVAAARNAGASWAKSVTRSE
jgi:hypothetical protein